MSTRYYRNDKRQFHKEDGPAVEWDNGYKAWWIDGNRHRIEGPARIWADGSKQWWIHGVQHTEEEFNEYISKFLPQTTRSLTL